MPTVKLTIEVEVPDDAVWLTVDKYGSFIHTTEPSSRQKSWTNDPHVLNDRVHVKNWRDLKINLKEYFEEKLSTSREIS